MRTIDSILEKLNKMVSEKQVITPQTFMQAAEMMNVLMGDETDKLFTLEQEVSKVKLEHLRNGDSVAAAEVKVEATDLYRDMKRQKAKIAQVDEMIRLSKLQARLKNDEIKNY